MEGEEVFEVRDKKIGSHLIGQRGARLGKEIGSNRIGQKGGVERKS